MRQISSVGCCLPQAKTSIPLHLCICTYHIQQHAKEEKHVLDVFLLNSIFSGKENYLWLLGGLYINSELCIYPVRIIGISFFPVEDDDGELTRPRGH